MNGFHMTLSKFPPLHFPLPHGHRHLAYSAVGDTNSNQTNLNYYDGLGRRFYIGAKATF